MSYEWDFDGDGVTDATGQTTTHDFTSAGTYTTSLTVTDNDGSTDTTSQTIDVADSGSSQPTDGVSVTLDPQDASVATGGTATYDVVVDGVTNGVGSLDLVMTTDKPDRAVITEVSQEIDASLGVTEEVAADGSRATIGGSLGSTASTGEVTIATVTVEGVATGSSTIGVGVTEIGDSDGNPYSIGEVTNATATVTAGPADVTGDGNAPSDPDGDGVYEDVNGDGEITFADLQGLYAAGLADGGNRITADNEGFFDFNGQDGLTFADLQTLYAEELRA
jgi:PKD repeat protein